MTVADYVVDYLITKGVTDIFGIPGGSILKLLYAIEKRTPEVVPHLNYHEQMAGFAACGYAQSKGSLGAAYAAKGPGIANMVTCLAEAYQESIPVLFVTAYGNISDKFMRYEFGQEMDIIECANVFTKYAARIDTLEEVQKHLETACRVAVSQRKGPVLLDFSSKLLGMEYRIDRHGMENSEKKQRSGDTGAAVEAIKRELPKSQRPVILIGDGIRQAGCMEIAKKCFSSFNIPVISSRASQDIVCDLDIYYGYIGSHGSRYSNFILTKADLMIVIGNSLSFPSDSKSFRPIIEQAHVIRVDIDEMEFCKKLPETENFCIDICDFLSELLLSGCQWEDESWHDICRLIKERLNDSDLPEPVKEMSEYLEYQPEENIYVCDVGNNEFWFSRAFEFVRPGGQVLYSKMFGTLGSAVGRAIGAYYATRKKVVCVIGDQGFQYNIQELQYISYWKLPITILLLNNMCSGMIKDCEKRNFQKYLHVTDGTGYSVPDFKKIVEGYGIRYVKASSLDHFKKEKAAGYYGPLVYEIVFGKELELAPRLPAGNPCSQMHPLIDGELYQYLNEL